MSPTPPPPTQSQKFAHSSLSPRKIPPPSRLPRTRFLSPPLNNNIHVITPKKMSHLAAVIAPIFILTLSYFLYTQVMLILILINVQYLQKVTFSFKKVEMVKFTPFQIPTTQQKKPQQNCPSLPLGGGGLPRITLHALSKVNEENGKGHAKNKCDVINIGKYASKTPK